MFNYDCVSFSSSIVNVPYVIILSVSICISSLLVWISINTFKTKLYKIINKLKTKIKQLNKIKQRIKKIMLLQSGEMSLFIITYKITHIS